VRQMGMTNEGLTWGIGPVALDLPLTNQTSTRRNTEAAVAAYNEAVITLQAKARQAVREVEESMVSLNAANLRGTQTKAAAEGYAASLAATQSRYRADARRTALFSQQNQLAVERDRIAAWINLYRATGGGWTQDTPAPALSFAPVPSSVPAMASK
jgi:outer membrane protein, multidrug efflux system